MAGINSLKNELITWNNQFPLDRIYRQKHSILFNSGAHRRLCQIDIYFDWLEGELFREFETEFMESERKADQYRRGNWLQEKEDPELTDEAFDKIVIN